MNETGTRIYCEGLLRGNSEINDSENSAYKILDSCKMEWSNLGGTLPYEGKAGSPK
jgi:hypothetical protein